MKKVLTATLFGLSLMILVGCSSAPEGTVALKDLAQNIEQQIGQKVVVVGTVDSRVPGIGSTRLFKLYRGNVSIWAYRPEGMPEPPQSVVVRVTGVVQEQEFPGGVGRKVFIQTESLTDRKSTRLNSSH